MMDLKSIALKTNLMIDQAFSDVTDHGDYIAVRTPSRPNFFWGNYIILRTPPNANSYADSLKAFESSVGPLSQTGFMTVAFDCLDWNETFLDQFANHNFKKQVSTVLTAKSVYKPKNGMKVFK